MTRYQVDENEDGEFFTRVDDMIFLSRRVKAGLSSTRFRWFGGMIPYKIQRGLPEEMYEMLHDAMDLIEEHTCIEFIEKTAEKNYIYISYSEEGCFSHVGMVNRGRQKLNLGRGCWKFGTIVHELIHSIGFSHEHQRNDRDTYITIAYENVEEGKEHNFKLDREMGLEFSTYEMPYNYASVMHYGSMAFSDEDDEPTIIPKKLSELSSKHVYYSALDDDGRPVIGLRKLTWGDVRMINLMYKDHC
ncbi:unnamed protein product [Orchesella dallaii]|uniref:Metalloendopeptidase n=1 Tax=Orchesella dallaii TaxID=48710 RepID=A0ABP1QGI7_9HEXA